MGNKGKKSGRGMCKKRSIEVVHWDEGKTEIHKSIFLEKVPHSKRLRVDFVLRGRDFGLGFLVLVTQISAIMFRNFYPTCALAMVN